jgi:hypothetical protein
MIAASTSAGTGSPVPAEVVVELDRLATRWGQLSLDLAQRQLPTIRELLDELTRRLDNPDVPDLGPRVVMDQLRVLTWDAYAADRSEGVLELLTGLRARLS